MDKLVLDTEYGVTEKKGVPVVSSRKVAEIFAREHAKVIVSVNKIANAQSGVSEKFIKDNFIQSTYKDTTGRKLLEYLLTRDGFVMLAMGFTGKRAMGFKEAYINRFNEMEQRIQSLYVAKMEHPAFTAAIMDSHEEPKHYHFSNEVNMINRIVLGMSAKEFKEERGIDSKVNSIRPYLNAREIKDIETLQRVDIGLLVIIPNYEIRKQELQNYYNRFKVRHLSA